MKRVHQGGHHDVWCDGKVHQKTSGGYVWPDQPYEDRTKTGQPYPCNCEDWLDNLREKNAEA